MEKDFFTITELSETLGLDESGIRKKCRLGKIKAEKIEDQWQISTDEAEKLIARKQQKLSREVPGSPEENPEDSRDNSHHTELETTEIAYQKEKITFLISQIDDYKIQSNDYKKQLEKKDNRIDELLKQQNQAQQLSAMQQKTIDKLTEQNQLLLETTQQKKPSFWQRLIGQKI